MALGTRTPAPEGVDSVCLVVEVSVGRRGRKLQSMGDLSLGRFTGSNRAGSEDSPCTYCFLRDSLTATNHPHSFIRLVA